MSPVRRPSTVSSLRSAAEGGPSAAATVVDEPEPQAQVEPEAQPQPQTQPEAAPAPGPPPRPPKPVRFTLDLSHSQHGFLKRFALEAEVDASKVMRVLLDQLQSDPELAQRVREAAWTVQ